MKSLIKTITIVCFMTFVIATQAQAQGETKLISGNSFNVLLPQGKFADTYDHGFGIYANFEYAFNEHFAARFDLGWNDVSGSETSYIDTIGTVHVNHPNMSVWEFTGGFKASISIFYTEIRGGYFTGVKNWGFVPAAGIRIGKFDIQANYSFVGDSEWASARIGYYWGK